MNVSLRPVRAADLDVFEENLGNSKGTGEQQWFGHRTLHAMREEFAVSGLLSPEGGYFTIDARGEVAGWMHWFQRLWGPRHTSWCWSLSIVIFPRHRGKGVGSRAHRELVTYLFDHTRAERIEAITDVTNLAEQGALANAGFEREGVIRRAQWRGGSWHDQLLYSVLRPEK
ncbi:GNAT family protein [Nonomuraea sp. NPDC050022]|uniref:GNAT family N-acetyltransferase n=1 Tax=unclassified Nonomuraea TaxID=2593643 RepID=UPI0033D6E878